MLTKTKGTLVLILNKIFKFVLLLKLKFNLVLKRLIEKCTITKIWKGGFYFSVFALCVLYTIYIF